MEGKKIMSCEERIRTFSLIKKLGGWKHNDIALWPTDRLERYVAELRERADARKPKKGED